MDWLDLHPEVRKAIYGLVSLLMAVLIAYEVVTAEQLELTIGYVERAIVLLTALMAFLKTHLPEKYHK